jgi:hypothetical protein
LPKNDLAPPDTAKIRLQAGICPSYLHRPPVSRLYEL